MAKKSFDLGMRRDAYLRGKEEVLLEDVNEQDPGDIVNYYDYEIIWSDHRGLL
jgi:hypothetical protein